MIRKGLYTTDNSDLYMMVTPKYQGKEYAKCKIDLFYKRGDHKGYMVESGKNYKVYYKNITHWKKYKE